MDNISLRFDGYSMVSSVTNLSIAKLQKDMPFGQSGIDISPGKSRAFIELLKKDYVNDQICDTHRLNSNFFVVGQDIVVAIRAYHAGICAVFARDAATIECFLNKYVEFFEFKDNPKNIFVTCYFTLKDEIKNTVIAVNKHDMGVVYSDLYPDIDCDDLIESYNKAADKILILYGLPGTGKTTFVKNLLRKAGTHIAYTKDLRMLEMDSFWLTLQSGLYDYVILDDLDVYLGPRSKNENSFVSKLLSFSDGLLINKTKIIITTNQSIREIDPAIVRPGRCFDFLELKPLTREQARTFWVNTLHETDESFDLSFRDDGSITQASIMMEHARMNSQGSTRSYIKCGDNRYTVTSKLDKLGISIGDSKNGF